MFENLNKISTATADAFDLSRMAALVDAVVTSESIVRLCNSRLAEYEASGLASPKHLPAIGKILFQTDHHAFGFYASKSATTEMAQSMSSSGIYKNISSSPVFLESTIFAGI